MKRYRTLFLAVIVAVVGLCLGTQSVSAAASITVPQSSYSVANTASPFSLNTKCPNGLTYSSSSPTVASVSPSGVVTPRTVGKTTISVIDRGDKNNVKKVTVTVSKYKKPNGTMAESMYNADGKSGDKSNRESMVHAYQHSKGDSSRNYGFIIRCTDPVVADKAATAVRYIVNNKSFGYATRAPSSQANINARASIYKACVKVTGKNPTKAQLKKIQNIKTKADTSCTPTLLAGYWLYYDMNTKIPMTWVGKYKNTVRNYYCGAPNVEAHQLEKAIKQVNKEYRARGQMAPFQIIYVASSKRSSVFKKSNIKKTLNRGDILCSCPKPLSNGHTVMLQ